MIGSSKYEKAMDDWMGKSFDTDDNKLDDSILLYIFI